MMLLPWFGTRARSLTTPKAIVRKLPRSVETVSAAQVLEDRTLLSSPELLADLNSSTQSRSDGYPGQPAILGNDAFYVTHVSDHFNFLGHRLIATDGTAQGSRVVGEFRSINSNLVEFDGALYFSATLEELGPQLWKTDGAENWPILVGNPELNPQIRIRSSLQSFENALYFSAFDSVHGYELWKTDGTDAGTVLVKDIRPGIGDSNLTFFGSVTGAVLLIADDGVFGKELWRTDGTDAGTYRLNEFRPGLADPVFTSLGPLGDALLFTADDGANGRRLWRTDGTQQGTYILPGDAPGSTLAFDEDSAWYWSSEAGNAELWRTDGTTGGTQRVMAFERWWLSPAPRLMHVFDQKLYFNWPSSDAKGRTELWVSDGTETGTRLLKEVSPGISPGTPSGISSETWFFELNGVPVFVAEESVSGRELWTTDGTSAGTVLLKDVNPGSQSSNPRSFVRSAYGSLYFAAASNATTTDLWKTDGTPTGTVLVKSINSGPAFSVFDPRIEINGTLFLQATLPATGSELWTSDGTTAGTVLVKDIYPGGNSSGSFYPTALNGKLLFRAEDGVHGYELWGSDGTTAGTELLIDALPLIARGNGAGQFTEFNGKTFFLSDWIYSTDGTPTGTVRLERPPITNYVDQIWELAATDDLLFFSSFETNGMVLYATDGAPGGLRKVFDRVDGVRNRRIFDLRPVGDLLYFRADGDFLWVTDGTTPGTRQVLTEAGLPIAAELLSWLQYPASVRDRYSLVAETLYFAGTVSGEGRGLYRIDPATGRAALLRAFNGQGNSQRPNSFVAVDGVIYFNADDGVSGSELWRTDGTAAGTRLVRDIAPGPASSYAAPIAAMNGGVMFSTVSLDTGPELWVSDGTVSGTVLIKSFGRDVSDEYTDNIRTAAVTDDTLYFTAPLAGGGHELWRSDGTAAGTTLVKDIYPGVVSSNVNWLVVANGLLYFAARDHRHGMELWRSDGTTSGTVILSETQSGIFSGRPWGMVEIDGRLYFQAEDLAHGPEPWTLLLPSIPTSVDLSSTVLPESSVAGTSVGTFSTSDPDFGDAFIYTLVTGPGDADNFLFAIDGSTLRTAAPLDFEARSTYSVRVRSTDSAELTTEREFQIALLDVDEFDIGSIADVDSAVNAVPENSPNGAPVGLTAWAYDADGTSNTVTYSITANANGRFAIDAGTGVVTVAKSEWIDREAAAAWSITVKATSEDGSSSSKAFTIHLMDVPEFHVGLVNDVDHGLNAVSENSPNGTVVGITARAIDRDPGDSVTYSLTSNANGRFAIHPTTGVVTVAKSEWIDREAAAAWSIHVRATSTDGSFSSKAFTVHLTDVNDVKVGPINDVNGAANAVPENSPNGTVVGITAQAVDADASNNAITYSLVHNANGRFAIDSTTGVVTVAKSEWLDYEHAQAWSVTVRATSADGSSSNRAFTISLIDVDESRVGPVVDVDAAANEVVEFSPNGTLVGLTARATGGGAITYSLLQSANGRFAIDALTGVVSVARSEWIDYEAARAWSITVLASSTNGTSSSKAFTIWLLDADE